MNRIYSILILFFLVSCSKDYLFNRDQVSISKKLNEIKLLDQGVREFLPMLHYKYKLRTVHSVYDSLSLAGVKPVDIFKFDVSKINTLEQEIKKMPENLKGNYFDLEVKGKKIYNVIDSLNAINLYNMIKTYGYPSYDNRKWTITEKNGITFVMTHINPKSKIGTKILKLMISEYQHGRVEEGEMKQYLWSIDGRNGYPYNYIINLSDWKKKI